MLRIYHYSEGYIFMPNPKCSFSSQVSTEFFINSTVCGIVYVTVHFSFFITTTVYLYFVLVLNQCIHNINHNKFITARHFSRLTNTLHIIKDDQKFKIHQFIQNTLREKSYQIYKLTAQFFSC